MQNKTFRLFISSTFSDFKKERCVLHTQVFPEIERYCQKKDFVFQPIDLRWGVSNEAQLDQKTLELCLEEVRVCKHFPHPNFLIMAGDRYGYIPLPYMIEKKEFEDILKYTEQNNETITIAYKPKKDSKDKIISEKPPRTTTKLELLEYWYKEDKNQIYNNTTAYILQPRRDEYKIYENWEAEENQLRTILQNAANEIFKDKENKEYQKYFTSATEAEVIEGICAYKEKTPSQTQNGCDGQIDKEYILGYLRTIKNPKGDYVDGAVDKAKEFKSSLTYTLKEENIKTSTFKSVEEYEKNSLEEFKNFLVEKLKKAIDAQKEKTETFSKLEQEISEQNMFKEEKLKGFQGRETTLKIIQKYIEENTDTTQPLVIHGASGMGKSSLMAKAISDANSEDKNLIYRFVGATANSTTIRSTLISLCDELHQNGIIENIAEYEVKEHKFYTQINEALSSISKHTVIFIDALDQLTSKNNLEWLPVKLPNSLKIVLSVLNDAKYVEDTHYYNILKIKYPQTQYVNIEEGSLKPHKELLIEELLKCENRQIDSVQKKHLLEQWEKTNYTPLYLKIAIEEVKHWRAGDKEQKLANGVEGIIKEYIENLSRIYHHDKIVVEKVFGYINGSKDGLSEKELLDILSEDLEDEEEFQNAIKNEWHTLIKKQNPRRGKKEELVLPLSIWSRLHAQLKPFIVERNIDNQPLMKFFHRQFTTVVDEYIKEFKIKLHTKLSDYFLNLQDKNQTWDKRYHNLHMVSEIPYQLFYSKDTKRLKEILFDLEFAGAVYDHKKQESFKEIVAKATELDGIAHDEIYTWESFYREKEHLIARIDKPTWKPHQSLFQLAYDDGENSSLKRAANSVKYSLINFEYFYNPLKKTMYRSGLLNVIKIPGYFMENMEIWDEKYIFLTHNEGAFLIDIEKKKINHRYNSNSLKHYMGSIKRISEEQFISYDSFRKNIYLWDIKEEKSRLIAENIEKDIVRFETIENEIYNIDISTLSPKNLKKKEIIFNQYNTKITLNTDEVQVEFYDLKEHQKEEKANYWVFGNKNRCFIDDKQLVFLDINNQSTIRHKVYHRFSQSDLFEKAKDFSPYLFFANENDAFVVLNENGKIVSAFENNDKYRWHKSWINGDFIIVYLQKYVSKGVFQDSLEKALLLFDKKSLTWSLYPNNKLSDGIKTIVYSDGNFMIQNSEDILFLYSTYTNILYELDEIKKKNKLDIINLEKIKSENCFFVRVESSTIIVDITQDSQGYFTTQEIKYRLKNLTYLDKDRYICNDTYNAIYLLQKDQNGKWELELPFKKYFNKLSIELDERWVVFEELKKILYTKNKQWYLSDEDFVFDDNNERIPYSYYYHTKTYIFNSILFFVNLEYKFIYRYDVKNKSSLQEVYFHTFKGSEFEILDEKRICIDDKDTIFLEEIKDIFSISNKI